MTGATGAAVPATCRTHDPATGGEVVLDDGTVLPYAPDALRGTPVRGLRPGQRLAVRLSGDPDAPGTVVVALGLPSLPPVG